MGRETKRWRWCCSSHARDLCENPLRNDFNRTRLRYAGRGKGHTLPNHRGKEFIWLARKRSVGSAVQSPASGEAFARNQAHGHHDVVRHSAGDLSVGKYADEESSVSAALGRGPELRRIDGRG